MRTDSLGKSLKSVHDLLSHLHQEIQTLEVKYHEVLQALHTLEQVNQRDELTGLLRRQPFHRKWDELLEKARFMNQSCGLLVLDIDFFKKINDQLGHQSGDEILRVVGKVLINFECDDRFAARFGGEEFLFAYLGDQEEGVQLAERIRQEIAEASGRLCTVSVGGSLGLPNQNWESVFQDADQALYLAKKRGRDQVQFGPAA